MIDISSLSFRYNKIPLFDQLNLSFKPGVYGLLGKNGAGKSTLLKIISGLLFPETGKCLISGIDSAARDSDTLARTFFLSEEIYLPSVSIPAYVKTSSPFYPDFSTDSLYRYMEEFDIKKNQKISSLSYGQRKKFIIAFGLATGADIILLDEPTNGLDIPSKTSFRKIIESCADEKKVIIISTHQVRDLSDLIDPVIIIDNGEIIFNYTMDEILERLVISFSPEKESSGREIYSEKVPGGWVNVFESNGDSGDTIDFEILFNAVISNPVLINRIMGGEKAI